MAPLKGYLLVLNMLPSPSFAVTISVHLCAEMLSWRQRNLKRVHDTWGRSFSQMFLLVTAYKCFKEQHGTSIKKTEFFMSHDHSLCHLSSTHCFGRVKKVPCLVVSWVLHLVIKHPFFSLSVYVFVFSGTNGFSSKIWILDATSNPSK